MKKYLYSILLLSILGAILAGALFYQHYDPEASMGILSCGHGLENPCISVGQSPYSKILGIPVAAFGLLYYLIMIFTLLIADYAGDWYLAAAAAFTLPLSLLALVADIILAAIMISIGDFCTLCFYTYMVNVLIFILALFWYRQARSGGTISLLSMVKETVKTGPQTADKRAALSSFTLFIFLLAFSIFATNFIMNARTSGNRASDKQVQSFLTKFYASEVEELDLPDTKLILGNPDAELTIIVFTDFLCSACYSFFKTEKYLLSRFKGQIKILYYHYPLDAQCNSDVGRTIYANSCTASRAVNAAAEQNILIDYLIAHFARYKEFKHEYTIEWASTVLRDLIKNGNIHTIDKKAFEKDMDSKKNRQITEDHIKSAVRLKIDATPTLFIAGRRLVGVPPRDLLEALVRAELKK